MSRMVNFIEFYPRKTITIGEKDRQVLTSQTSKQETEDVHWLIVLKGAEVDEMKIAWKVSLMTSKAEGIYDFTSQPVLERDCTTFQEGMDLIKEWEIKLLEDRWFDHQNTS